MEQENVGRESKLERVSDSIKDILLLSSTISALILLLLRG